jgi:transposase
MVLSVDLRKRVVAAVDGGMTITEAAKVFKVCKRVIYNWLLLRKITDSLEPKSGYQHGHSHKITDLDQFKTFAEKHRYCTSSQMKIEWKKLTGVDVSKPVILRTLKKIGFTFKKKHFVIPKQIKKNGNYSWKKLRI